MVAAFFLGISQLNDRPTQRVLWISIVAATLVFVLLWAVVGFLLSATSIFTIGWLEWAVDLLGGLATFLFTWFLFPGVVSAVIGIFLDDIAAAVEARHYPDLGPAMGLPVAKAVLVTLGYLGVLIVLNLFLLVFLLLPPLFPFVFYSVNGYLLGREYFELLALRRVGPEEARRLRKAHRGKLFLTGAVMALLLTLPVVNLLAPVVITATMVHLFERWRRG
ncbi:MAG: EI24 domain-containing protein [Proteobacteria bacterium]|nr:EI24 domain-containing protein [Pseudomonadota bacterium]